MHILMKFSIVIPSYQQGRFIENTIQSVLAQNVDKEIFVQDGGSTDDTIRILEKFKNSITWESRPDGGQTCAINAGLKKAEGDIFTYLNSDDVLLPGALEKMQEIFSTNPDVDFAYGMANLIDPNDTYISDYPTCPFDYHELLRTCFICQPACMFRKKAYERLGPFDEKLDYCMDYEYWLRAGKSSRFYYIETKIACSRYHPEAKTIKYPLPVIEEILDMLADYAVPHPDFIWIRSYLNNYFRSKTSDGQNAFVNFSIRYILKLLEIRKKNSLTFKETLWLLSKLFPTYKVICKRRPPPVTF